MAKEGKIIWALFILSAVLAGVSIFSFLTAPVGIREYDVIFAVEEGVVGFDLNTSALTFGKIIPGGSSTRNIFFENYENKDIEIEILASENIAEFMDFQSEYFIPAKQNATIPITVTIPLETEDGEYLGKVKIQLK